MFYNCLIEKYYGSKKMFTEKRIHNIFLYIEISSVYRAFQLKLSNRHIKLQKSSWPNAYQLISTVNVPIKAIHATMCRSPC